MCPGCGAKLADTATVCDLCGTTLHEHFVDEAIDSPTLQEAKTLLAPIVCASCTTENKVGANFCFHCGADLRLQSALPLQAEVQESIDQVALPQVKKQVYRAIGFGALSVVGLFGITSWSKENFKPTPPPMPRPQAQAAQIQATPIPESLSKATKPLQDKIAKLQGEDRKKVQLELASLYHKNERHDKAGEIYEDLAQQKSTADAWALAGHAYYDWMMKQPDGDANRVAYAQKATVAYEKSLALKDNPDVRTDMAVAYLNDPQNPMKAIQNTNQVLDKHPNHVQANLNKGVMLLQVGRQAQAKTFFEKVIQLTKPEDAAHERAKMILEQFK